MAANSISQRITGDDRLATVRVELHSSEAEHGH